MNPLTLFTVDDSPDQLADRVVNEDSDFRGMRELVADYGPVVKWIGIILRQ